MSVREKNVLTQFLLPLDLDGHHDQTLWLMKCLALNLGQRVERITLFHVTGGRYLSRHMTNIDVRAGAVISTEKFRELRQVHIDRSVLPVLKKVQEELHSGGISAAIDIAVEDGEPVEQIVKKVNGNDYSSLILQRSTKSAMETMFIGNVTSGTLHHEINATIYLPPAEGTPVQQCPPRNVLVALDGSTNSLAALERAKVLAAANKETFEKIILATVLDVAQCSKSLAGGMEPKSFDSTMLDHAAAQLAAVGLTEKQIVQSMTCGEPAVILPDLVKQNNVDMIFMGRRERGALKELFMGSVSSRIIQQCLPQTVVLVNGE